VLVLADPLATQPHEKKYKKKGAAAELGKV
jgi:hypothetical protein